jgi:hypothetical protein
VKILLIGVLIIAMIFVALPLPMVSGIAWCPGCLSGHASSGLGLCFGILSLPILILALSLLGGNKTAPPILKTTLVADSLLRPPRFAVGL